MKSLLATATRNSGKYIQEYVCYHYLLGFDRIVLGLHKCEDDTLDKILKLPDFVLEKVDVVVNTHREHQRPFYLGVVERYHHDFEWMALIDDDEYFYDSKLRQINEILYPIPDDVSQLWYPTTPFGHNQRLLSIPPAETRLAAFTRRAANRGHTYHKCFVRFKDILVAAERFPNNPSWYYCHGAKGVPGKTTSFDGFVYIDAGFDWSIPQDIIGSTVTSYDICNVHYAIGALEDLILRARKWHDTYKDNSMWEYKSATLQSEWRENSTYAQKYNCDEIEDTRMLVHVEPLRQLLSQCQK